jgi:hypothetical protein
MFWPAATKRIRSLFAIAVFHSLCFACQAQAGDPTSAIKDGIKKVVGLIMAIAFVSGVIIVMYGAKKKIDGEPGAYYSIVGGAILAMAPLIIGALYYAFGQSAFVTQGEW